MTQHYLWCLVLCSCLLGACSDPNYHQENYQAFASLEELNTAIHNSIQTQDEDRMLQLLDNQTLLMDLLLSSEGEDAAKTRAFLGTPQGQRNVSQSGLAKKQRINAFFGLLKNKQPIDPSQLELQEVKQVYQQAYAEGSPAMMQAYQMQWKGSDEQVYAYDFQVIYWNNYYHLIEAAGFINKLTIH